mgnify:CR=1 FL=1
MSSYDYSLKEPFYVKNISLMVLAVVSVFVPPLSIVFIPLLFLKMKNIKAHFVKIEGYSEIAIKEGEARKEAIIKSTENQSQSMLENAKNEAHSMIEKANSELNELNDQIKNKSLVIQQFKQQAIDEANKELSDTKADLARINAEIEKKDFYMNEINTLKLEIESLDTKIKKRQEKINQLMSVQKSVNAAIKTYFKSTYQAGDQELILPAELIRQINTLAPDIILNLHAMDYKDLRRAFKANEKLIDDTLERYEGRYTTKANQAIYQLMVIALRAELQNVLYTLTYSKLSDAVDSIKNITNKYLNIARSGSQIISSTLARFIGELEPLFVDAVKIEYEYYVKKEAARQEQLELRAKMREEAEERKRLKEQQAQMEKEEQKYTTEIQNIQEQLKESQDDEKTKQLLEKIKELESQLGSLAAKKEEIVNLQNGKAGYVYVISNLGSFGDDVFKVGMTRRLDPQERVDELGDASVPFKFDVHSFIFSEDAVQLESDLHAALEPNRLNKVNPRKEFFKISLDELEALVEKYDPTAEFNRTMVAEQYHQSLSMAEENRAS